MGKKESFVVDGWVGLGSGFCVGYPFHGPTHARATRGIALRKSMLYLLGGNFPRFVFSKKKFPRFVPILTHGKNKYFSLCLEFGLNSNN